MSSGMWRSVALQPPADAGSPLADFSSLKIEAIRSSETSVNPRSTQCHIPEDDILHRHRCGSLKSYIRTSVLYPVGCGLQFRLGHFTVYPAVGVSWLASVPPEN
jgi:hypothetical protein